MALTFGAATSNRVDHGNIASAPTQFTILVWVNPTTLTTTRRFAGKGGTTGFINFGLQPTTASQIRLVIDYSTTDATADSATGTVTTGAWQCFAGTFDGTTAPKIYKGTLTTRIAEVTYNTTPVAPSGTRIAEAVANFYTGNDSAFTRSFQGDIAFIAVWNRALSAGELLDQQFDPHKTSGCILFTHYGFNGVGSQADWSGNVKNGTVTGATLAASHVPLLSPFGFEDTLPYVVAGGAPLTTTGTGSAGLGATCQSVKLALAQAQAELGSAATDQILKIGIAQAQAETGLAATELGLKIGRTLAHAQLGTEARDTTAKIALSGAVAAVGVRGQCASGVKLGVGTARASAGLRATAVGTLPGAPVTAPRLIWVDGRLALRLSPVIYERL